MMQRKLRITFAMYRPGLSGGSRVTAIYARELARRGHDVRIVCMKPVRPTLRSQIKRVLAGKAPRRRAALSPFVVEAGVPFTALEGEHEIRSEVFPDADVVVATFWPTAYWIERLPPEKGAKAYFIQHHETHACHDRERVAATYRMPLYKITISKWLKDIMATCYGDENVAVIHNSVDTDLFNAPPREKQERPAAGFLYSTTDFKRVADSLAALEKARQARPDLRLVAFGANEPTPDLPIPPGCEFHLRPAQSDIPRLYAACDVWLCSSASEGFALPPLEAMACRTPPVSTRVGAMPELIEHGVNGYLVDVGDVDALAARTLDVLRLSPERWRAMSDAAHKTATGYTWSDAASLFEAELFKAVNANASGPNAATTHPS